jgi:hypothetical protein
LRPPAEEVNWIKWASKFWGSTNEKPTHDLIDVQREPKVLQKRNKC